MLWRQRDAGASRVADSGWVAQYLHQDPEDPLWGLPSWRMGQVLAGGLKRQHTVSVNGAGKPLQATGRRTRSSRPMPPDILLPLEYAPFAAEIICR